MGYVFLSCLAVALLCLLSAVIMYFTLSSSVLSPTIKAFLSTAQYMCLGELFRNIAIILTQLENPRTDTEFDRSLVTKRFVFEFINAYGSLFYLAFFKLSEDCEDNDCGSELRNQVLYLAEYYSY
jgi:hypothetical protein